MTEPVTTESAPDAAAPDAASPVGAASDADVTAAPAADHAGVAPVLHDHTGVSAHAHQDVVRVLHALADPTRLSLVHLLADGAQRVVDLTAALGLAQSTVSAHLATLRTAGLVVATPEGRATRYSLADPELDELLGAAERVVARTAGERERRS